MQLIKITKNINSMSFDDFLKLGLKPQCLICERSTPEGFFTISCRYSQLSSKYGDYKENLYLEKCNYFKTDFHGIEAMATQQYGNIAIKYRNRIYAYKFGNDNQPKENNIVKTEPSVSIPLEGKIKCNKSKEEAIKQAEETESMILENKDLKYIIRFHYNLVEEVYETAIEKIKKWFETNNLKSVIVPESRESEIIIHGIVNDKANCIETGEYKVKYFHKSFTMAKINKKIKKNELMKEDIEGEVLCNRDWNYGKSEIYQIPITMENIRKYITDCIRKNYANVHSSKVIITM